MTKKLKITLFIFLPAGILAVFLFTIFAKPDIELLYKLTVSDPLFTKGEINPTALKEAVEILKNQEESLKNTSALEESFHLYPYGFFLSLADASEAAKSFLEDPEEKTALELLMALEKNARYYSVWADMKMKYLNMIPEAARQHPIVFLTQNTATTFEILKKDIELAQKNALLLKKEVKQRSCLLQINLYCLKEKIAAYFASNDKRKEAHNSDNNYSASLETYEALPLEILFPEDYKNIQEVKGPYAIPTNCFSKEEEPVNEKFIVAYVKKSDGTILAIPKIAVNAFYLRGRRDQLAKHPVLYFQFLLRRGWDMFHQPEATDYTCPDYAPILKALSLAERGTGQDLSGIDKALLLAQNGLAFFTDFTRLGAGNIGTSTLAGAENITEAPAERRPTPLTLYLLADRSSYALNFFNYNPAIWRIPQQPLLMKKIEPAEDRLFDFVDFLTLERNFGRETAEKKVKSLKPQRWWLEELAKTRPLL